MPLVSGCLDDWEGLQKELLLEELLDDYIALHKCPKCRGALVDVRIQKIDSSLSFVFFACMNCGHEWCGCRIKDGKLVCLR